MKILILFVPLIALLFCACENQIAEKSPPKPVLPYKPVKTPQHTSQPGHSLYMTTCYQCHMQADPATLSFDKWKSTVPAMAQHAGITQKEGQMILDYILQIKSQGVR